MAQHFPLEDISVEVRRVMAHLIPIYTRRKLEDLHFLRVNMEFRVVERTLKSMILELRSYVLEDRRPATWWQKMKNRWFPDFFLKWFPVAWSHYVCPHIPKKVDDERWGYDYKHCLGFLEGPQDRR